MMDADTLLVGVLDMRSLAKIQTARVAASVRELRRRGICPIVQEGGRN